MSASPPTWLLLLTPLASILVATVSFLAAIAVAALTHFLTTRRERNLETLRWQRERDERREQWEREDAERWRRDRMTAYSELLVAIERWIDLARTEKPYPLTGRREISRDGRQRLDAAVAEIDKAEIAIDLLAPESIRGMVRSIYVGASSFPILLTFPDPAKQPSDEEIEKKADERLDRVIRRHWALRTAIRRDLGIEPNEEDQTSTG